MLRSMTYRILRFGYSSIEECLSYIEGLVTRTSWEIYRKYLVHVSGEFAGHQRKGDG